MANGPMGGFMPTPAAPAQPPSVKLETTAVSRGNFNTFLKNMNGAMNPPLAPIVGAVVPTLAPTMSDIDIFNPPMQMMQFGGEVDDFGDFSSVGDDAPSVDDGSSFFDDAQATDPSGSDDNQESIVGDDPVADIDFNVVTTPTVTEQERQQNIQDAENFITGTTQFPTTQNFGSRINLTGDVLEEIKKNINIDNIKELSMDDSLFKDNQLTAEGQTALDAMNALTLADVRSGVIPASNFITATSASDVLGDKDKDLGVNLKDERINEELKALDRAIASTKAVTDRQKQLANVTDQTLADRVQLQRGLDTAGQTPIEISRVGDDQLAIDEAERSKSIVGDDFGPALDMMDARTTDQILTDQRRMQQGQIPSITTTGTTTTSTLPEDFEENVGRRFDPDRMADIERLFGEDVGQTKAGRGSDPTFFEGRGMTGTLGGILDAIEGKTRENMATQVALGRPMGLGETLFGFDAGTMAVDDKGRALVGDPQGTGRFTKVSPSTTTKPMTMEDYMANTQKNVLNEAGDTEIVSRRLPEDQLIRNDSGRIIGIRDESGRLVSGMDPNASVPPGDDSDSPIILPTTPKPEEKPPTNIGVIGGANPFLPSQTPVVVDSPFTTNVGDFQGTGFTTGDLNRLIQQITGIRSPRSMAKGGVAKFANGGLIKAVDDFLATGT